jgi:tetratricopeptide (TPR) repeat protein
MSKQKKKRPPTKSHKVPDLEFSLKISPKIQIIIISVLILLTVPLTVYYILYAFSINHTYGFPIDDPWIHLTFAKNIAEYGSFSYFKNEVATSGSTSPIFTFLLAVGFFITKNEMLLGYTLGIIFMLLAAIYFYRTSALLFNKENWIVIGALMIFIVDRWLNLIAVSGMETTLYVFMLISCYYYYLQRKALMFSILIGLMIWCRPDGLAFIATIIFDYALFRYLKTKNPDKNNELNFFPKKSFLVIASVSGILIISYIAFNLVLSGSVLPNTFSAKLTYYSPEYRSWQNFLHYEVWNYFTDSVYIIFIIPFFVTIINIFTDTFKGKYNKFLSPAIFVLILIFIYTYKLPYAHRFGRYLIPVIPFYILMFMQGSRILCRLLYKYLNDSKIINGLNIILIIIVILWSASAYYRNKDLYQEQCHYILSRQVAAANWLKNNTPEGSIIATHDVGAIGYYSGRKIIDVFGLINPEYTDKIFNKDYNKYLEEDMKNKNVSYVAFIKEYLTVANQTPQFIGGENDSEIMYVYKYDYPKTHILSMKVNSDLRYSMELIANKQFKQANYLLLNSLQSDTLSSPTLYLLAYTSSALGDVKSAEKYLAKALELYPGYREAVFALGNAYKTQNKITEAKKVYGDYLKVNPSDTAISGILSALSLADTTKINK